jgi:hypothetical protein
VDYYSSLLFAEIKKISPGKFCEKINFCISEATNIHKKIKQYTEDTCSTCEEVVEQITIKLKDPDTQVFTEIYYLVYLFILLIILLGLFWYLGSLKLLKHSSKDARRLKILQSR